MVILKIEHGNGTPLLENTVHLTFVSQESPPNSIAIDIRVPGTNLAGDQRCWYVRPNGGLVRCNAGSVLGAQGFMPVDSAAISAAILSTPNPSETVASQLENALKRIDNVSEQTSSDVIFTEGWNETGLTASFTGTIATGGYITLILKNRTTGSSVLLGSFDDTESFTFNDLIGNSYLMVDTDKVETPGNVILNVRTAGATSDLKQFIIPIPKGTFTGYVRSDGLIGGQTVSPKNDVSSVY
jgi:hypothetical protein